MTEIKFGNIANPTEEVVHDIHAIAGMGFDFVELNFVEPQGLPVIYKKKSNKIRNAIRQYGMFAYAHAQSWADLGSLNSIIREAWIEESKNIIDISKLIGIRKLNFHAYTIGIHKTHSSKELAVMKERVRNFVLSFNEIVNYAKKNKVEILYENTWEKYDDFVLIAKKVSGLELNVDIAHAFLKGGMPSVKKFLSFSRIEHMHISDNKGKNDDHFILGNGEIDFISVVKILKKINYSKTMTFEIFEGGRRSPEKSLNYFKKLLVKA